MLTAISAVAGGRCTRGGVACSLGLPFGEPRPWSSYGRTRVGEESVRPPRTRLGEPSEGPTSRRGKFGDACPISRRSSARLTWGDEFGECSALEHSSRSYLWGKVPAVHK